MPRSHKRRSKKAGLSPGTLIHVGEKKTEKVKISLFNYDCDRYEERELPSVDEALPDKNKTGSSWLDIDGIHRIDVLEKIGNHYNIHPLALEDILNTAQRPKMEDYNSYLFIVLKMLTCGNQGHEIESEQVSLVLGPNFVLSFQERPGDFFDSIRQRIRTSDSRVRRNGADYLVYRLLDTVVDNYFLVLEKIGERIEILEDKLMNSPSPKVLEEIHRLKRDLIDLRKSIWPLREVISGLQRDESGLIKESTGIFLRDVYDHTIQAIDAVESYRDILASMLDIYLSSLSNKMNEIVKVLTIISTIFIPLTFIAGIYGMNFNTGAGPWNMPELNWYLGYPAVIVLMAAIGIAMVGFFKKKKWI